MASRISFFMLVFALSALCVPGVSWADDPFGFEQSGTPDQYSCEAGSLLPPNYYCAEAPRNHPSFDHYEIKYHQSVGVCTITAITAVITDETKFRSTLAEIKQQVEGKYGSLKEHFNKTATIENKSGIRGGNITAISLWPDFSHNVIKLSFEFLEVRRCEAAAKADHKDGF